MANVIKGLLPSGMAPSVLKAEIIELVKTEAPAPDLSPYATKEELEKKTIGIPIFQTLAEAKAWETQNPGKVALTLETSAPDTVAPKFPAGAAFSVDPGMTTATLTLSAAATDDRRIEKYQVQLPDSSTWVDAQILSPTTLKISGLAPSTAYDHLDLRAVDAGGNPSNVIRSMGGFKTLATPPVPYEETIKTLAPKIYIKGSPATNTGTQGALSNTSLSAPETGDALGGYLASYALNKGSSNALKWQTKPENGMVSSTWSYSFILRVKQADAISNAITVFPTTLRLRTPHSPDAPQPAFIEISGTSTPLWRAEAASISSPVTVHVGVECDGAETRYYLNGVLRFTGPARAEGQSVLWFGFDSGTWVDYDVAGLAWDSKAWGAAVFAQLAKDAGVGA